MSTTHLPQNTTCQWIGRCDAHATTATPGAYLCDAHAVAEVARRAEKNAKLDAWMATPTMQAERRSLESHEASQR